MADEAPLIFARKLGMLLDYDPETGLLRWKHREEAWFRDDATKSGAQSALAWNKRFAGKLACTGVNGSGYRVACILGKRYPAHRLIWLMVNGAWPNGEVDHINGDRTDNRIANLRDVSKSENQKNRRLGANNKSGHVGVSWSPQRQKWTAQIKVAGRQKHLGAFDDLAAAVAAREAASEREGYHPNHGRSANV